MEKIIAMADFSTFRQKLPPFSAVSGLSSYEIKERFLNAKPENNGLNYQKIKLLKSSLPYAPMLLAFAYFCLLHHKNQ